MIRYLLTRLLTAVPVILGVVSLTFVMMYMLPGDPASTMLAKSGASAQQIAELRAELGLDRPLYVQYFQYLFNVLTGDMGESIASNRPVFDMLLEVLPMTLVLVLLVTPWRSCCKALRAVSV